MSEARPAVAGSLYFGPIAIGVFVITIAAFVRAPLLPELGRDLDMSPTALGAFVAVFALGRIAADVPAGRLTDRHPTRAMLAVGAAIVAVAALVAGVAPTSTVAFAGSFLLGVGSAWTNTAGIAAFAEAPIERRGVAMSGFAAALMVGQSIGPAVGGVAASIWDWRAAFSVAAVLAFTIAIVLGRPAGGSIREVAAPSTGPPRHIGRAVLAAIYLLPAVQFGIGAALIHTLIPIVGDAELSLSVGTIGLAIGLGGMFRLVGALASGQITDRVSRRWALFPGLALQLLALGVFAVGGSVSAWWASIILFSLGSSAVNVGATMLADLSEGDRIGHRLGWFRLTGDVSLFVAPLVGGAIYEALGREWATSPLIVFVVIAVVFAYAVIPETAPRRS